MRFHFSFLLVLLLALLPRSSAAQSCSGDSCEGGPSLFFAISAGVTAFTAAYGVVGSVGNGVHVAKGVRAPTGWLVVGYTSAALNFGSAAFTAWLMSMGGPKAELGLLLTSLIVGGVDLAMTILGHTTGSPQLTAFLPRPSLMRDRSGAMVVALLTPAFAF